MHLGAIRILIWSLSSPVLCLHPNPISLREERSHVSSFTYCIYNRIVEQFAALHSDRMWWKGSFLLSIHKTHKDCDRPVSAGDQLTDFKRRLLYSILLQTCLNSIFSCLKGKKKRKVVCPFKQWYRPVSSLLACCSMPNAAPPGGMGDKVIWITAPPPSPLRMSLGQISSLLYMEW